jgi:spore coat polysaccharide biosynthesis protein SpsF (cytidylyltransferase family)/aryl-alcohol dehydrogenase-like predicted oxidoreductase
LKRTRVVIQSRLNSSRLPGKAMLTIAGMPLIELVARRAGRSGHEVVVATSDEPYDRRIAEHLQAVGISVMRGPLDDVLGRFVEATADLEPDDRVVRMTGDNPVADADLVDELLAAMDVSGHIYGRVDIERVPEGLGAEAFTVGSLRTAAARATSPYDREHVTPWLRRELGELLFVPRQSPGDPRQFRCTVDVLADYDRAFELFSTAQDPVWIPWQTLMSELGSQFEADFPMVPIRDGSELAQSALLLDVSRVGVVPGPGSAGTRTDGSLVRRMMQVAVDRGISHVATDRGDDRSEATFRLGSDPALKQRLGVVTLLALRGGRLVLDDRIAAQLAVESSMERSFAELGRRRADAVLFDGVAQAVAGDGAAWRRLVEYQRAGQVGRVGVRVRTPAELVEALQLEGLGYLQLPFDALDRRRWLGDGMAEALESSGAVVAARSLAVTELLTVPPQAGGGRSVESISLLEHLDGLARDLGREGVADLCMAYALGQTWLTSVVIHPETEQQLLDQSRRAARAPLNDAGLEALEQAIPDLGGRP